MKPRVMIVGLGSLGSVLLETLARDESIGEIVVASRDGAYAEARINLARVGALAQGVVSVIRYVALDLDDTDAAAAVLAAESPSIAICTASRQAWWAGDLLPDAARAELARARFGAWLPVHLSLAIRFMQAVRKAGFRGHTVIASFPDVVNVVLARLGLAPTCGFGNLDEIVPKVRLLVAARVGVSPRAVRVLLVAHHALEPFVFAAKREGEAPPYWIRVECDGEDVGGRIDLDDLLLSPYPLPSGPAWHFLTASSALHLVRALAGADEGLVHVPGPAGLPGGYPVVASRAGVRLLELPGLSREDAVAINERSERFDGVERIEEDGTVQVEAASAEVLKRVLGYNGERIRPSDADARAVELVARFREYAARHGVDLAAALQKSS